MKECTLFLLPDLILLIYFQSYSVINYYIYSITSILRHLDVGWPALILK